MTTPKRDRPGLPKGYIKDTPKGMLTWVAAKKILTAARYVWLATTDDDGKSHLMQLADLAIYGDAVADVVRGSDRKLASKIAKQYAAKYGRSFKYRPKAEQYQNGHVFRGRPIKLIAFNVKKFETSAARFRFAQA